MQTLLLDIEVWDLVIDASNNIAVASNPYALAQDAASEIKLYQGELYWDTTRGIPYTSNATATGQILGLSPPANYMKQKFDEAALLVPEVVAAQSFIESFIGRKIKGQVQVTDREGAIAAIGF